MNLKHIFTICALFIAGHIFAQTDDNPVLWKNTPVISDTGITIQFDATIADGWHLYSQHLSPEGPLPTVFNFDESTSHSLVGEVTEPVPHEEMDEAFQVMVKFFEHQATFSQEIKLSGLGTTVKGNIEYMVCNDAMCFPLNEEFIVDVRP